MKRTLATIAAAAAVTVGFALPANAQTDAGSVTSGSDETTSPMCIIPGIQIAGSVFQAAHAITETGLAVASLQPFKVQADPAFVHPLLWKPLAWLTCSKPAEDPDFGSMGGGGSVWPLGKPQG